MLLLLVTSVALKFFHIPMGRLGVESAAVAVAVMAARLNANWSRDDRFFLFEYSNSRSTKICGGIACGKDGLASLD